MLRIYLSVVGDPDDFASSKKLAEFWGDTIAELHPHDDGARVVMASGREYVVEPTVID